MYDVVVIWGRQPPPLGGVTRCVQALSSFLTNSGVENLVVDWRQRRAVRALFSLQNALHIHNVSNVNRLVFVAVAKRLSSSRSIVYFHSGTLAAQMRNPLRRFIARYGFRCADDIWATNAELASDIERVSGVRAKVVSPFSVEGEKTGRRNSRPKSVVCFVGFNKPLYGLSMAIRMKALATMEGWSWTIVAYGDDESCLEVRNQAEAAGMRVVVNLDQDAVRDVLRESEVLIRPTSADGDALVVREALAVGTRVVASDVVPRPTGVELSPLSPQKFAAAIVKGGEVSDGGGLGFSVAEEVLALVH